MLLAEAGILTAAPRSRTTPRSRICATPAPHIVEGARFVDDGDVITAAGVTSGIDMALHIVAQVKGDAAAAAQADEIEWTRTATAVS